MNDTGEIITYCCIVNERETTGIGNSCAKYNCYEFQIEIPKSTSSKWWPIMSLCNQYDYKWRYKRLIL